MRSRLTNNRMQKSEKNLVLSILGIILVFIFVFKFGIPLLINLSLFLAGSKNNDKASVQTLSFIAPPVLNYFPQATSSANIVISGIALKKQTINLYVNGNLVDGLNAQNDGKFVFTKTLKPGKNIIYAKAIINGKESSPSNIINTVFKNSPPPLSIIFPSDGESFSKDHNVITVRGTTDPGTKVTVNDHWAITDDNGNYSYTLTLQNGENKITIISVDSAGNESKKEIKINYSS